MSVVAHVGLDRVVHENFQPSEYWRWAGGMARHCAHRHVDQEEAVSEEPSDC